MEQIIEKDFEDFFNFCQKENFSNSHTLRICYPLIWRMRVKKAKPIIISALCLILLYLLYNNFDAFAWSVSAFYRTLLIKLLLPFWNWKPLYNSKCLVERSIATDQTAPTGKSISNSYEMDDLNCVLCETLERITRVSNTTFSSLESNYLERGYPVIVADSHEPQTLNGILNGMLQQTSTFLSSKPCDLLTNLMLLKFFDIELALHKLQQANHNDKWLLQFRNCRSSAVKASRQFFVRPYFYPRQLEPFYTSWLLLSFNYNYAIPEKKLHLVGNLIIVVQLSGSFDIQLRPKQSCKWICPEVNIRLKDGESLVFTTDLWIFKYNTEMLNAKHTSIAAILEIDWLL